MTQTRRTGRPRKGKWEELSRTSRNGYLRNGIDRVLYEDGYGLSYSSGTLPYNVAPPDEPISLLPDKVVNEEPRRRVRKLDSDSWPGRP